MAAPGPLMVHGHLGPFIHTGAHNDGHHEGAMDFVHRDTWVLVGLLDGFLSLRGDGDERRLPGPVVVLVPPGDDREVSPTRGSVWYSLRFDVVHLPRRRLHGSDSRAWCRLEGTVHQPTAEEIWGFRPPTVVPPTRTGAAIQVLRRSCALWWRDELRHAQANALLGAWLMEHVAAAAGTSAAEGTDLEARCRRWVEERMYQGIGVADLAKAVGLSVAHFKRRFQADTGITPGTFIRRLRLEEAARRLRGTDHTVEAVADFSGYRSVSAFVRAFAREFGQTPAAWRRSELGG